ncbi:MAG TPA: N-acetyltransferase [Gammaproteobacteria bacterium]|nr:N-acetyltransferase [Gammaproteobacteria bacterium]HIK69414.1 N-acetyltransferase [Pseudomonadales bacterium]|tara:strand:- start:537 stop:1292 length:756 start_codon:yes stop_codon:yes gene_type:complete
MSDSNTFEKIYPRPLTGDEVNQMPSALVPSRSSLKGRYVVLEPQNAAVHASDLYHASHDSDAGLRIWDYMVYGPWPDEDSFKVNMRQQSASFETIFYAIRALDSGRYSGQAGFLDINPLMGVIEIGHIWFAPTLQRTRAATEALYLMISHAMDDLDYRRIHWRCNALNEKSRHAARRLGFRFEGVFYNHMIFKGKSRDTAWYSILDDEWPEVRGNFETWLHADNFDANGLAKTSLTELMQERSSSQRGGGI